MISPYSSFDAATARRETHELGQHLVVRQARHLKSSDKKSIACAGCLVKEIALRINVWRECPRCNAGNGDATSGVAEESTVSSLPLVFITPFSLLTYAKKQL
jgi:hypothetical protein